MSLADEIGSRRCELLFAAPGQPLAVIEIDGSQHRSQALIDMRRDRALANAGVPVIRVPAAAARAGRGAELDNVASLLTKVPDPVGAGNSAVVVDVLRCGPMLSPRVPNLVPIPGPRMERETLVSAHDRIMGTHVCPEGK